jgi:ubiquitin C-terminal hydrolase
MDTLKQHQSHVVTEIAPSMKARSCGTFGHQDTGEFMDYLLQHPSVSDVAMSTFGFSTVILRKCKNCQSETVLPNPGGTRTSFRIPTPCCAKECVSDSIEQQLQIVARANEGPCSKCGSSASRTVTTCAKLSARGKYLILHLSRGVDGLHREHKSQLNYLSNRVFLSRTKCTLIATARHHGMSVNSGHATMCGVRNGRWWHMDDSSVSSIADPDTTSTVVAMYRLQ